MGHFKVSEIYHQENISVYLSVFLNWVFSFIKGVSPHRKMLKISMPGQYILLEGYVLVSQINRLTPNDPYMGRTAPLTSKRCVLYIYSTNIGTEYFKHALYSPFFLFKMQFVS